MTTHKQTLGRFHLRQPRNKKLPENLKAIRVARLGGPPPSAWSPELFAKGRSRRAGEGCRDRTRIDMVFRKRGGADCDLRKNWSLTNNRLGRDSSEAEWGGLSQGFSLVGVLVALTMVSIVAIAVTQLLTRAEQVAQLARSEFVAANLAREGLELIRVSRDTNWFSNDDRTKWITEEKCNPFTYDVHTARRNNDPRGVDDAPLYIDNRNGEWGHRGSRSELTRFSRILEIDCTEKDHDPADPNANPPYVIASSRVFWEEKGQQREVVLKEKLYNWLP